MNAVAHLRQNWLIYCLLIAVTLAIYVQTLGFPFINYDDPLYVVLNNHVKHGLGPRSIAWAFTNQRDANWIPLVWLSYMLDHITGGDAPYKAFGHKTENPRPYHRTNLILHVLNTLLLFAVLSAATGMRWRSALVAALFAIHPLHVESVAWIAERKDCLSTLFLMLTLGAYIWYARQPCARRYALVVIAFALGLMSKSMLVTVPILLLALDFWPLQRLGRKTKPKATFGRLALEKVPLAAMSLAVGIVTLIQQKHLGALKPEDMYAIGVKIPNAIVSYVLYMYRMFWPARLCVAYPHPRDTLPELAVVGCGLVLVTLTVAAVLARRRAPYLFVGWLWYVITLLPVIGIVQVGDQGMADRYTYITLIGLFVAVVWGAADLAASRGVGAAVMGVVWVLVVAALGAAAYKQVGCWRGDIAIYSRAVDVTTDNPFAHRALGVAFEERRKDCRSAIEHYRIALSYWPQDYATRFRLAQALHKMKRLPEAAEQYRVTLRLKPDAWQAANNLAMILATETDPRLCDPDEAVRLARIACRYAKANRVDAMDTLAVAYAAAGRYDEAIETATKGAELADACHRPRFAREIRSRLPAYRAHRPCAP